MSNAQPTLSHPRSDVRNTVGKDKQTHPRSDVRNTVGNTVGKDKQTPSHPRSAVDLEEFCEKHYEKLLPIMADKYEHERRKKEKLEEVKARLEFGDVRKRTTKTQASAYSESRIRSPRRHMRSYSPCQSSSIFTRLKRGRSRSPRHDQKNKARRESSIRDPIVLHNIKQRDGESTEDFIQRYKLESGNVKGASKCMRISRFMHGITNPELIKRFHEKIPKIVDEMIQVATSFLQG
ncbi:hypothetical protein Tco_1296616, partial [Tanacetum coccineum]